MRVPGRGWGRGRIRGSCKLTWQTSIKSDTKYLVVDVLACGSSELCRLWFLGKVNLQVVLMRWLSRKRGDTDLDLGSPRHCGVCGGSAGTCLLGIDLGKDGCIGRIVVHL